MAYMKEFHAPAYDESSGRGLMRHVFIRSGFHSGEVMVCLVVNGRKLPMEKELTKRLCRISGVKSILLNVNQENTNVILGEETRVLWGDAVISDALYLRDTDWFLRVGGKTMYQISLKSFYQVNPLQTEKLYSLALAYAGLTGEETVWDLYCGIGTISLFLAGKAKRVYGIEAVPEAVADARKNAELNGISNVEFIVGKVEEVLAKQEAAMSHADVVVVDPPRKGCDKRCLETILAMKPEKIIYVSCDPATLARDLRELCDGGYGIERMRAVDQFGQTVHTECVVWIQRKHI